MNHTVKSIFLIAIIHSRYSVITLYRLFDTF